MKNVVRRMPQMPQDRMSALISARRRVRQRLISLLTEELSDIDSEMRKTSKEPDIQGTQGSPVPNRD